VSLAIVFFCALIGADPSDNVAEIPGVLVGIDSIPTEQAVATTPTKTLLAVFLDVNQPLRFRVRAARLLERSALDRSDIDTTLRQIASSPEAPSALRAQSLLAFARRALARREMAVATVIAEQALSDHDATVARAGVFLVWWLDGPTARTRLEILAARADSVGAAARGRLRAGPAHRLRSRVDGGGDDARPGVLDSGHGGPSFAR
jgi:hypothetical protein